MDNIEKDPMDKSIDDFKKDICEYIDKHKHQLKGCIISFYYDPILPDAERENNAGNLYMVYGLTAAEAMGIMEFTKHTIYSNIEDERKL